MSATYQLQALDGDRTELKMISYNSFSPGFMKYAMRGPMSKSLQKHLFGLKYYLETDEVVTKENYSKTSYLANTGMNHTINLTKNSYLKTSLHKFV